MSCRHRALLKCEMPWASMSYEVLFPSSPSVMAHVTILHPAFNLHSHLGGRGELVQPSKEQKTDCRSPKPLVCPHTVSPSLWFHVAYTEPASAPRLMSPAANSCKFLKKVWGCFSHFFFFFIFLIYYLDLFPRFFSDFYSSP